MSNLFVGPLFEIVAGQTTFLAHASVLEKSEKLRVIVQGRWKDSTEHKILLEDWDSQTVGRLLEWLYTGDYQSPFPAEAQAKAENLEVPAQNTSLHPNPDANESPKDASAKGSQRPLMSLANIPFNKADPELGLSNAEAFKLWAAKFPQSSCVLDFEAALLTHAKLYALADYMLLPALQAQIFQRLKALFLFISAPAYTSSSGAATLSLPLGNTPVIGNIITLIQYVYANTTRLESEDEPLRELISTFIALHYDQFDDEGGEVLEFMAQGGEFQGDVHDKVRRNEITLKNEIEVLKTRLEEAYNANIAVRLSGRGGRGGRC